MVGLGIQQLLRQVQVALGDGGADTLEPRSAGAVARAVPRVSVACTAVAPTVAAVAAARVAAALPRGLALALDLLIGLVDLFHALLCQIGQRVVVIVVGMVFPRQITIGFLHFIVRGGAGHAQHLIGITHRWCPPFV